MHAVQSKLTSLAAISMVAAVSCTGSDSMNPDPGTADASASTDSPPVSSSCYDNPPTTAPDPLVIDGTVVTLFGSDPVDAAHIEARRRTDDGLVVDQTTVADGLFSLSIDSGGDAWNGYFAVTRSGMFSSYLYFATAVSQSYTDQEVPLADQGDMDLLGLLIGQSIDTNLGIVVAQVYDCEGLPVAGARVSLAPTADVIYLDGSTPDPDATATYDSGSAIALNVPVGTNTVSVTLGDTVVETVITSEAQSLVGLFIKP